MTTLKPEIACIPARADGCCATRLKHEAEGCVSSGSSCDSMYIVLRTLLERNDELSKRPDSSYAAKENHHSCEDAQISGHLLWCKDLFSQEGGEERFVGISKGTSRWCAIVVCRSCVRRGSTAGHVLVRGSGGK
jgi:hypothetical protein